MNKYLISLLAAMALIASTDAFTQDEGMRPDKQRAAHHRGAPAPVAAKLFRAIRGLELSDTQEDSLDEIMFAMKKDLRPVMKASREGHKQLKELIDSDNFDEAAVAAIAEKEGDLAAEKLMITSRAMSEALQLLSDEQREELKARAAEHRELRKERRQQRDV